MTWSLRQNRQIEPHINIDFASPYRIFRDAPPENNAWLTIERRKAMGRWPVAQPAASAPDAHMARLSNPSAQQHHPTVHCAQQHEQIIALDAMGFTDIETVNRSNHHRPTSGWRGGRRQIGGESARDQTWRPSWRNALPRQRARYACVIPAQWVPGDRRRRHAFRLAAAPGDDESWRRL